MKNNPEPVRGPSGRFFTGTGFFFVILFVAFLVILIAADVFYVDRKGWMSVATEPFVRDALWLTVWTSAFSTALCLIVAVPMGYIMSRHRFPGHVVVDTLVDLPVVFPPLVAGMTLLVFFYQTEFGRWLGRRGLEFAFQPKGIVLCQFFLSASFAIRAARTAFDEVDRRLENVALTLGCNEWTAFFRVALPLARNGILAGGILAWMRAFGIFGPLIIFVGTFRGRTEVLSTTILLEQSVGNLGTALAISILMIFLALVAIIVVRLVDRRHRERMG
ncbi:MAG: ABC transporter permease [Planctomycetota bacterium]